MGDSQVSILDGNTFVVSDDCGDIDQSPTDPTGLFAWDTRFLSQWVLTVNGDRLSSLSTDELQYFQARFFLIAGTGTVYVDAKLSVIRTRSVGDGFHEEITLINHAEDPVDLTVRIDAGADFADLFEVKDALKKQGAYRTRVEDGRLVLGYERERFHRETIISASRPAEVDERGMAFSVHMEPKAEWSVELEVAAAIVAEGEHLTRAKYEGVKKRARPNMEKGLESWVGDAPGLRVRLGSAQADIHAQPRRSGGASVLAAERPGPGPPGRRAAVVHDHVRPRQHLHEPPGPAVHRRAGRHHLRELGARQGARVDDFRDEDPGRIPHELRYGELTAFEERPHSPYYGNADATALYVVLLDEYERWTGDRKLVRELEFEARAALRWIDDYADLDGKWVHLLQAAQRADRPREPVLEGLVGLHLLPRRQAPRLPPGDV